MYPNDESPALDSSTSEVQASRALAGLWIGSWSEAERGFLAALTRVESGHPVCLLPLLGVAQAKLFGRLDARGTFALLQSVLEDPLLLEDEPWAARLHVIAAFLFSTPEPGLLDAACASEHVECARQLLSRCPDAELSALAAYAELQIVLSRGEAGAFDARARALSSELSRAESPVTRCFALEAQALAALARADFDEEFEHSMRALSAARAIDFGACEGRLLARQARRALELGLPGVASSRLREAAAALVSAGAESSWLQVALSDTTRELRNGRAITPASFGFAATGLRVCSGESGPEDAPQHERSPPSAQEILHTEITRLAPSRATVLLVGGSARLKAATARALHERSGRAAGPFIAVDCATLHGELEQVLFGGSAYVAVDGGAVLEARRGTLYVASVDALPLFVQPRLLRLLDESVNVRVVASTAADLRALVSEGAFRWDLGGRLTLVELQLPDEA